MSKGSGDPFDEVIDMVGDAMRSVSQVERDLSNRVTEDELREVEKDLREYADRQDERRHRDQTDTLKQLMENMGSSLLNDFEEMGKDTETRLFGRLERFIDEDLTPLVGRLVTDEVKRKDELARIEAERAEEAREKAELKEELRRQKLRTKIFAYVSALGVTVTMIWTAYRFITAINGAG
jgi:type I site-specific restriction endonuclease